MKTSKRPASKKQSKKQSRGAAVIAETLPESPVPAYAEPQVILRGQERLPDGRIRLKTGDHSLGETPKLYEVHGVQLELSGKVMIASKDVDWISIGKCQKCATSRPSGVILKRCQNHEVVVMFRCDNNKCDIGGMLYVQVHSPNRFVFVE